MQAFERQQSPGKSSETVAARPDRAITRPLHAENPLLAQQRSLGNQAVQRLLLSGALQAKLRVGPPNDAYEREADRVADTVMRMPEPEVQRQRTEEGEEEEEDIRTEPLADGITPLVQRQAEAPPEKEEEEEEEPPQVEPAPGQVQPLVQRQEAEPAKEEEEEEEPQAVQPKAKGARITHVRDAALVQRLRSPSGGSPLSGGMRSFFERRFGYDFSEVRVHDTYRDRADAVSLNARAFTYGKHIWLGDGESATDSRLMAHELTHVVQQDAGVRRRPLNVSPVSPRIQRQLGWLKEKALGKLAQWAKRIPGFDLLTVILGKDPITDEPVERNAVNLTRGVLGLLGPPGIAMFENLEKSGAIARAFEWLNVEISKLNLTWDAVKGLFRAAWEALDLGDIVDPAGALEKLRQIFGPPLTRLVNFAFAAGRKILEFVFEGALSLAGGFGTRVMAIVRRAGAVFTTIINDPIKFLGNLVTAIRGGFERFADNILDHLRTGLLQWLLGALSGAGLTLPDKWDLRGIVSLILQVLGLSYDRSVRPRLVKLIGERAVALLEGVFDFVKTLVTGGLSAAWEKILEYAENLQEMVIGAIRDWVARSVVGAAITKLITMFNPVGAVIQGIITIYNTIVFFIERAQQIAALAEAVFDSIANIAAGNLGAAISYVERTMARALPVIISFLARLIGLGGISDRIKQIIGKVQALVDKAIDKVVDFIVKRVKGLLAGRQQPGQAVSSELGSANVDAGTEHHRVYVVVKEGRQKTMIASTPTPAISALDAIDARITNEIPVEAGRKEAQTIAASVRAKVVAFESAPGAPPQGSQAYAEELARLLAPLYALVGHPAAPETVITPTPAAHGGGRLVLAAPLTRRPPPGQIGQSSTASPIPADADVKNLNKVRDQWVKLHLLSFRLHGPDQSWNFAPGTKAANSAMETIEWEVIDELAKNEGRNVMAYRTEVFYRSKTKPPPSPDETKFPRLVKVRRGPWDPIKNEPKPGTKTTDIEVPSPTLGAASLSSASINDLVAKGLPRPLAQTIFDGRVLFGRPYRSADDIIEMIAMTRRFDPERPGAGAIPAAARFAVVIDSLVASGQIVYSDQEI